MQVLGWGLLVVPPDQMYDRQYEGLLNRAREKIEQAGAGGDPAVAQTFEEMGITGSTGEANDGGA